MVHLLYSASQKFGVFTVPMAAILLSLAASLLGTQFSIDDQVRRTLPYAHFIGTSLLFILLPAYLAAVTVSLWRSTEKTLRQVEDHVTPSEVAQVRGTLREFPHWRWLVLGFGLFFGISQNSLFAESIWQTGQTTLLDLIFVTQSIILWVVVADATAWRVNVSYSVSLLAKKMQVDVYNVDKFKPIARMATLDVLFVAGAMAFMPLQSLDAEFRIWNYQAGFFVGTLAAIFLFLVPLRGARERIRTLKTDKLDQLRNTLAQIPADDISRLETQLSHIDRVSDIADWPIDLKLISRVIGYVIIPPVAWIGASLVENYFATL